MEKYQGVDLDLIKHIDDCLKRQSLKLRKRDSEYIRTSHPRDWDLSAMLTKMVDEEFDLQKQAVVRYVAISQPPVGMKIVP